MTPTTQTTAMAAGRRADTARRRERVVKALLDTTGRGEEVTVSGIARYAGIDRTFLYRHRDLLEQVHAAEAAQPTTPGGGPTVSRASLQADLLAAQERTNRLTGRIRQLEKRLSHDIGEKAWHESGFGAPTDIEQLQAKITNLEQQTADLRLQLEERNQDLDAARAANRDLMTRLNTPGANR
jgi:hypothetical protein